MRSTRVTRFDELWHLDMTSVWLAEHGWWYLDAAIGLLHPRDHRSALGVRCRAAEAIAVINTAIVDRSVARRTLTLNTDSGTAFSNRAFPPASPSKRSRTAAVATATRKAGRSSEILDETRMKIAAYIDRYYHDSHSRLAYRTPREVAATWQQHDDQSVPEA